GNQVAALPSTDDPEELYRNSYEFILSGDYKTAEAGFRDHIARFPTDPKTADAHFWLGESLLGQQKYRDAAETFLAASKDYPQSKKAPEMLLKLGMSLAGLK
ncbi:tol-pal system protein YbgF, partial [Rhizobiaceae sp. 2RAB30]